MTVAPSAEAAEARWRKECKPDIVLLDINLPGDTGWSVLRSEAFEEAGRPPVVVASAMAVSPARLREFGVAGYLPKPFALDTLESTLQRLLSRRRWKGNHDRSADRLDLFGCIAVFSAYLLLCERVGR